MKPRVIFVTDPLCSWCWATLPEVMAVRAQLADQVDFDLMMGGLQIGQLQPLSEFDAARLRKLWSEIGAASGQVFSGRLPGDPAFIYHSEIPCRAVEAARVQSGAAPWAFFEALQHAFYVEALNTTDLAVLAELASIHNLDGRQLLADLRSDAIAGVTRTRFAQAKALGAHALPTVLLDTGEGPRLVTGGYVKRAWLQAELVARLSGQG